MAHPEDIAEQIRLDKEARTIATCKECVLMRYPQAHAQWEKNRWCVYFDRDVEHPAGIAGSAKAAWHYAYATMVTRTR